jgi:predicted Zn-dependent peptidase
MKDRLLFNLTTLSNGMKVYSQFDPSVEFVNAVLVTPIGSAHNAGDIIPGSFHYLEHMLMKRSELYSERGDLKAMASLLGGRFSAMTWYGKTSYDLLATKEHFPKLFKGACSHFFNPIFLNEEVITEASTIANERERRAPFFPGMNDRSKYMRTVWAHGTPFPLRQVFGIDEDFQRMNAEYFFDIHNKYYKTDKSYLVIGGNFDLDAVCKELESFVLSADVKMPAECAVQPTWNQKDFHAISSKETSRFEYHIGSLFPILKNEEPAVLRMMVIMDTMFNDYSYGVIMDWLRHQKHWCYELGGHRATNQGVANFELTIPLNSMEQVTIVRSELASRIIDALKDKNLLEKVKQHKKNLSPFWYQTIESRMKDALEDLHEGNLIETEEEYFRTLNAITTEQLQEFFHNKVIPNIGELVFVPEK